MAELQSDCSGPLSTFGITRDRIAGITPWGIEEVFDLQVEGTENFIANGFVSHNTRWHLDDLAGRILASDDAGAWEVVNLPAEAEADDPLGRQVGEALCPDRFDAAALADRRRVLGPSYYALYQQRPVPREGGMVKREWLANVVPAVPKGCRFVRYWDKAGSDGRGDYTAGVLLGRDAAGLFYVADVVHGQWAAVDRERIIKATAGADRAAYGTVRIVVEQEPGSGGKESAESTIRSLAGYVVAADRPTGDKAVRLEPFAAQAGGGNVRLVTAPWNGKYVEELTTFPAARHDDMADATAGAFNALAALPQSVRPGLVPRSETNVVSTMPADCFRNSE
jgi:predicted phage terminase large subunit-like protein